MPWGKRMSNAWFRLYSEFASDQKVQMMNEAFQRRLVMLFCFRCNGNETLHDTEAMFLLRIDAAQWGETKSEFIRRGFIDSDNQLMNWNKRQFRSDSSSERVRKHRQTLKQPDETQCNVSETPQNRTEQIQNRTEAATQQCAREVSFFQQVFDHARMLFPELTAVNTSPIYLWQQAGYDFEKHIKPALDSAKAKGKTPRSFTFFSPAIEDAASSTLKPAPAPEKPINLTSEEREKNRKWYLKMGRQHPDYNLEGVKQ